MSQKPGRGEAGAGTVSTSVIAPAKVNLGLRVLGRRPDGYHRLESLFVPIDLADELWLEAAPSRSAPSVELELQCDALDVRGGLWREIPDDGRNLAVRAAHAFLERSRLVLDLRLRLVKRIPAAAGLGGGSSDAAAVLRALAELFPDAMASDELARLALSLGADVPFFLDPRPALVGGIGEQIEPVAGLPSLCLLLVNPGESVATAQVYEIYDVLAAALTPVEPGSTLRAISGLRAADEEDERALARCLGELLSNDLEPAALRLCPPVGRVKRRLLEVGALAAGMSGSGATAFGVFAHEADARAGLETAAFGESSWARVAVSGGSR